MAALLMALWGAHAPEAHALAQSAQAAVPAEFNMPGILGVAQLSCDFRYPERALDDVVQGRELELRVTVRSDVKAPKYGLKSVDQEHFPGDQERDYIRLIGSPRLTELGVQNYLDVRLYDIKLQIDEEAPPRPYDIDLLFDSPGAAPHQETIRLFVGARKTEKYVDASAAPPVPPITAGAESLLSVEVLNRFPTYLVTLRHINVRSDPPAIFDEVDLEEQHLPPDHRIPAGGAKTLDLRIHGKGSLLRYLSPFELQPRLSVKVWFDDGFRSNVERVPAIPIDFRLNLDPRITWTLAVLSVVVGTLLGAWIRMTVVAPSRPAKRLSTRTQIAASLVLSLVIVLLVVLARVEVLMGSGVFRVPLHKPAVTLVISFVLGLYDPSELVAYLRQQFPLKGAGGARAK